MIIRLCHVSDFGLIGGDLSNFLTAVTPRHPGRAGLSNCAKIVPKKGESCQKRVNRDTWRGWKMLGVIKNLVCLLCFLEPTECHVGQNCFGYSTSSELTVLVTFRILPRRS